MEGKTATIMGATGLIGSHLLELLQNDDHFQTIRVLVRRPVSFDHPKVQVSIIDFADDETFRKGIAGSDAVFCAVGTTQKKVKGDKDAYRRVDYNIPVRAAQFCAETGCPHFLLVSSVGATSRSNNFYLHLKGEVEDAVRQMNIPAVSVFRPSILLGKREEFRLGERIGQAVMESFSFLLPSKYKPVQAHDVARAMITASKRNISGVHVYQYKEIMDV